MVTSKSTSSSLVSRGVPVVFGAPLVWTTHRVRAGRPSWDRGVTFPPLGSAAQEDRVQDRGESPESDAAPKADRAAWPDLDSDNSTTKAAKDKSPEKPTESKLPEPAWPNATAEDA